MLDFMVRSGRGATPFRHVIVGAALTAALTVALTITATTASAQAFPDRPITMIVPFPPGGTTDIIARVVGDKMGMLLKHPVIVDNRPGAGGNTGADMVAKSKPDGYTIMMTTAGPLSINQFLYTKQAYDPARDFAAVSYVASVPIMLVSNPQRTYKTVAELIAYARANPGKLSYGSQGNGTTSHLTMELLKYQAKIDLVHVPYRGSAPASSDLMGGQIDVMFDNSPSTFPQVQAQKMRALGIASATRNKELGDIPAIAETVPGFESTAWFGVVAPVATPPQIIAALNATINAVLKMDDVKAKMASSGVDLIGGTPEAFQKHIASESAKWSEVIRRAEIRLD